MLAGSWPDSGDLSETVCATEKRVGNVEQREKLNTNLKPSNDHEGDTCGSQFNQVDGTGPKDDESDEIGNRVVDASVCPEKAYERKVSRHWRRKEKWDSSTRCVLSKEDRRICEVAGRVRGIGWPRWGDGERTSLLDWLRARRCIWM